MTIYIPLSEARTYLDKQTRVSTDALSQQAATIFPSLTNVGTLIDKGELNLCIKGKKLRSMRLVSLDEVHKEVLRRRELHAKKIIKK